MPQCFDAARCHRHAFCNCFHTICFHFSIRFFCRCCLFVAEFSHFIRIALNTHLICVKLALQHSPAKRHTAFFAFSFNHSTFSGLLLSADIMSTQPTTMMMMQVLANFWRKNAQTNSMDINFTPCITRYYHSLYSQPPNSYQRKLCVCKIIIEHQHQHRMYHLSNLFCESTQNKWQFPSHRPILHASSVDHLRTMGRIYIHNQLEWVFFRLFCRRE